MSIKDDVPLDKFRRAMIIWKDTPHLPEPHKIAIDYLITASEVSLEHVNATALWLFDEHEVVMTEAVASARHFGILRNWDAVEATV